MTFNALMEKTEIIQYQAALAVTGVHGKVHVAQRSMKNWAGNHYLVVVGVGAFCKYIRLRVIRRLLVEEILLVQIILC